MASEKSFVDALTNILIKNKVVNPKEASAYHEQSGQTDYESFEDFLLSEGLVEKEHLLNALSRYYQFPAVDVQGIFFDSELLRNFPKQFLLQNKCIPWEIDGEMLVMIAAVPNEPTLEAAINRFTDEKVEFNVGYARDIIDAVQEYYDKAVSEVPEDADLDDEREEMDEFDRKGELGGEDRE